MIVFPLQFELALKSLGFLLNIYQLTPSLTASYQSALATYCQLGVREGADICWGTMERRLLGAVRGEVGEKGRGGRSTSHLTTSYLKCRLALATLYLHRGEVGDGLSEGQDGELCSLLRLTGAGQSWWDCSVIQCSPVTPSLPTPSLLAPRSPQHVSSKHGTLPSYQ